MKKIIVALFAVVMFAVVSFGQDRQAVKIEVSGFDNNTSALLFVSKYASQKTQAAWRLVRSNPEYVMRVRNRVTTERSWTEVDQSVARRNDMLKTIERQSRRAVNRIPRRYGNGWVRIGAQVGRDIAVGRYVQPKYSVERFRMLEIVSTVTVEVYDPKTREVVYSSIGVSSIVIKTVRMTGYEPVTILASGDLSQVGMGAGENLGNQYRQLLGLAAFMESERAENSIMN